MRNSNIKKKRAKRNSWCKETMQKYCDEHNIKYIILNVKWVEKPYQKQLWAYVKCDNEKHQPYWVWWNNFLNGYRCKECEYEKRGLEFWNEDKAYSFIKEYGYLMIDKTLFKNVDKPVPCKDKDGFIYMISITNLKNVAIGRQKSFSIFKNNPYAIENIKLYCKLYRDDYEIISEKYLGVKEKHIFKYNGEFNDDLEHNRYFECTIDCFINGQVKHPDISMSKGELKTMKYFKRNNINYISQHTFSDCKDKQVLPFDFYLPDYNLVVEIMGKQHESPIEFWGGQKNFEYVKKHDNIKRQYLENNHINILDIWYYDFSNIEKILTDYLKPLSPNPSN